MSMIKLITSDSFDFSEPMAQMIKISSRGLIGADELRLVKRAGLSFRAKLDKLDLKPGDVPVHLIALGSMEKYSANRNGDAFPEATCRRDHPTFVKHARWYRHHQNKNPDKSYGYIADSAYNEDMGRIELLGVLNGTKEAADRNGGLVADEEMEKLASDEAFDGSMACTVPFDRCNSCGNIARTRKYYCKEASCPHGGLSKNIGKVFSDGHHLCAINDDCDWFDWSSVHRRADRIGLVIGMANEKEAMLKAASENRVIGGAELAELSGVTRPLWTRHEGPWDNSQLVGQMRVASSLIEKEASYNFDSPNAANMAYAFHEKVQLPANDIPDVQKGQMKLAHVITALSELDCLLPPADFFALIGGGYSEKTASAARAVSAYLPTVYSSLSEAKDLESKLRSNPYIPEYTTTTSARHWASKHASDWSLSQNHLIGRLQRSALRECGMLGRKNEKIASYNEKVAELAQEYALYQLGFLYAKQTEANADFYQELALIANGVRS